MNETAPEDYSTNKIEEMLIGYSSKYNRSWFFSGSRAASLPGIKAG